MREEMYEAGDKRLSKMGMREAACFWIGSNIRPVFLTDFLLLPVYRAFLNTFFLIFPPQ